MEYHEIFDIFVPIIKSCVILCVNYLPCLQKQVLIEEPLLSVNLHKPSPCQELYMTSNLIYFHIVEQKIHLKQF